MKDKEIDKILSDDLYEPKRKVTSEELSADVEAFLADKRNKIEVLPFGVSKDTPKDDSEKAKLSKRNQYNWGRCSKDSLGREKGPWHDHAQATMRKARGEGL